MSAGTDDGRQGDEVQLAPKKQSFSQQLLVWTLVIAVGVLFGMGPALAILQGPGVATIGTVSQTEALDYKNMRVRLDGLLGRPGPVDAEWGAFARQIHAARRAEQQGLMPKGETLDAIVSEFLTTELPGGQTVGQRLAEYERSDRGLAAHELKRLLQIERAVRNLQHREVTVPVVPTTVIRGLKALEGDQVELAQVELSTRSLIDEFRDRAAEDEATLQVIYDELKNRWFRIPARSTVTVFAADPAVVAEQVVVTDEEVAAFYEREKTRRPDWRLPDEEPAEDEAAAEAEDAAAEEPPEPRYKPLDEVREEAVAALKEQHAVELAKELYDAFSTRVRKTMAELGVAEPKDMPRPELIELAQDTAIGPETHGERLAAAVAIVVDEGVEIEDPEEAGEADLPGHGAVRFAGDLFGDDAVVGSLDEPVTTTEGLGLLLRLEATRPGSYREFEQVRDQVVTWHAARLAWPTLLERAQAIAGTAADMGADALASHFAPQEVQDRWQATVETTTVGPLETFSAPSEDVDGAGGESWPAIAMASHERPVRLATATTGGPELLDNLPAVQLVQVTGYQPAGPDYRSFARDRFSRFGFRPKTEEDWVDDYRNALANHLFKKLQDDLTSSMLED